MNNYWDRCFSCFPKAVGISLSIILFSFACLTAQEKNVSSSISEVTVFFQGAQVNRVTPDFSLPQGQTVVVLKGLERSLNENSLRVGVKGSAKILNLVKTVDFLDENSSSVKIEALNAELKNLEYKSEEDNLKIKVYEQERNLLMSNMSLGGANTGVNVSQIKEGADYYRSRLMEIEKTILTTNRNLKSREEKKRKIRSQLSELNYKKNRPTSRIELTLESDRSTTCGLLLDYIVPEAGWKPCYDLRIDKVGEPVQVARKAKVVQNTGEAWENVSLSFSTGNPMEQQVMPVLYPWYIDFYYPQPRQKMMIRGVSSIQKSSEQAAPMAMVMEDKEIENDSYDMASGYVDVQSSSKNSIQEFRISTPATISPDGEEYTFAIGAEELPASYHYMTIPKKEKSAYLVATVTDWEGYELVDGTANLYYENMFIGETFLNASMTLDSMQLSMGKDRGIVVERKAIKDMKRERLLGSNIKKSYAYEILVRNTKDEAILLFVEDQVPLSRNTQIEVDLDDIGNGKHNDKNGRVRWEINIEPGETITIPFRYSVKYPKDEQINM